jgi:hypothetical protein
VTPIFVITAIHIVLVDVSNSLAQYTDSHVKRHSIRFVLRHLEVRFVSQFVGCRACCRHFNRDVPGLSP